MEEALREEKEAAGWEDFLTMRIIIYDVSFLQLFYMVIKFLIT
jgi:hypothetical protein